MTSTSRILLIAVMTLLVLSSACNLPAQPPSGTTNITSTPLTLGTIITSATPVPAIPITGMDVVSLQCQFCVNDEVHAVLIMSNQAFFNVSDPSTGVTCLSASELNGRRILLCRGAQQASFTLNVCVDSANCLQFPITLQPCPLIPGTGTGTAPVLPTSAPVTPVILTPRNTLVPPTNGPATIAPSTPVPTGTGVIAPPPTSTTEPAPEPTSTTEPPATEPPTSEPPDPTSTSGETGGGGGGGGGEEEEIVICHISPGNPDQRRTMTVSQSSWEEEHSQHGDSRGPC